MQSDAAERSHAADAGVNGPILTSVQLWYIYYTYAVRVRFTKEPVKS